MVNHPNRKLTPKRKEFLASAIAVGGDVFRSGVSYSGRARFWQAGAVKLTDTNGDALERAGLIERVLRPGTSSTERMGMNGYRYRVTDAGRAALDAT